MSAGLCSRNARTFFIYLQSSFSHYSQHSICKSTSSSSSKSQIIFSSTWTIFFNLLSNYRRYSLSWMLTEADFVMVTAFRSVWLLPYCNHCNLVLLSSLIYVVDQLCHWFDTVFPKTSSTSTGTSSLPVAVLFHISVIISTTSVCPMGLSRLYLFCLQGRLPGLMVH